MTISRHSALVVVLCLCAAPARAAIVADFDGDGVHDRVVSSPSPGKKILISVSGSAVAQVLRLNTRPLTVVAADLDHDGDLDLAALSLRLRVHIWLNDGDGNFVRLRARHAFRRSIVVPSKASFTSQDAETTLCELMKQWVPRDIEDQPVGKTRPQSRRHAPSSTHVLTVGIQVGDWTSRAPPAVLFV